MQEEKNYETLLEQANKVIAELGKSDLPLDRATKLYKEGVKLLDEAAKLLENAKLQFEEVQNSNA
ncbi:MAG: exodeoxyribonuclease VII small subunit [Helicobacteraceae bacterium]|jgi:exodeoxyribonuclease VII small subunit|nr:exodeoxyribonuclease VII small subunit [Helicobacteraceae bacterium]